MNAFAALGLAPRLVDTLAQEGIDSPFPVQTITIPDALSGRDLCGKAPTGSGKTLAYGLAVVQLVKKANRRMPTALILVPTRELAQQVASALTPFARAQGRWVTAFYGGAGMMRQIEDLRRGVDIAVATPGRLTDLINRNEMSLEQTHLVVVDEADRMADMGFTPQVTWLLDGVAKERQILLFSATLDGDVEHLVKKYMDNPVTHSISSEDDDEAVMRRATHLAVGTATPTKFQDLAYLCDASQRTILFVKNRFATERTADALTDLGVSALAMHGGMTQAARSKALARWASGGVRALVATDVAARGVHVDAVDLVVHVDPPQEHKDYLHRSGRTARAGATGVVVSMLRKEQRKGAAVMFKRLGVDVDDSGADEARDLIRAVRLSPKLAYADAPTEIDGGMSLSFDDALAGIDGSDGVDGAARPVAKATSKPRTAKVDEWAGTEARYEQELADPDVNAWGERAPAAGPGERSWGDRSRGDRPGMPRGFERKDRGDRGGRDFRPPSGPRAAGDRSWSNSAPGSHDRVAARSEERSGGRPSWAGDGGRPAGGGFRSERPSTGGFRADRPSWAGGFEHGTGAGRAEDRVGRPAKPYGERTFSRDRDRDGARDTGRGENRPWAPRGEGAAAGSDRPARSWQARPSSGRPEFDRSGGDRAGGRFGSDHNGARSGGRPDGDRPRWDAPRGDRPASGDRPRWDAPRGDRPAPGDRPDRGRPSWNDRPATGDRPDRGARPGGFRSGGPRTEWAPRVGADRPASRPGSFDRDRDGDRGPRSDRPAREGAARWSTGAPGSRSWTSGDRPGARADTRGPSGPGGRPSYGGAKPGGRPGARGASTGGFQGSPKLTWRASRPK